MSTPRNEWQKRLDEGIVETERQNRIAEAWEPGLSPIVEDMRHQARLKASEKLQKYRAGQFTAE